MPLDRISFTSSASSIKESMNNIVVDQEQQLIHRPPGLGEIQFHVTKSTGVLPFGPNLEAVGVVLRDSERSCLIARLEGHNSIIASGAILNEIEQQLEYGAKKGDGLRFFPRADRQTQEMHFQTMMQDIAASLLMEFEKYVFQAEYSGTILKTPLDSKASLSSEEV
uniref:Uncharacterized protein n=1 Tax=Salix viminalis TaxID=40686 RepID=A0A6N2LK61_SALVM